MAKIIYTVCICRKEIGSPTPMKQAVYICDAISQFNTQYKQLSVLSVLDLIIALPACNQ